VSVVVIAVAVMDVIYLLSFSVILTCSYSTVPCYLS
jgi:hypothetical protein